MVNLKWFLCLLFLLGFVNHAASQAKPVALKMTVISPDESDKDFTEKLSKFLKVIAHSPRATRGFIAIASNVDSRYGIAKQLLRRNKKLKSRVAVSLPGTVYDPGFMATEFWMVPKGAEQPYRPHTYDITCPTIFVTGPAVAPKSNEDLVFVANVSGGSQDTVIRYRWTVQGGKITNGAGTPSITVRANRQSNNVTASVKILGFDDDYESCPQTASFTLKVEPTRP